MHALKVVPNMERIYIDRKDFYGKATVKRHLERYRWVLKNTKECDIALDLCCGSGYGTHMISKKAMNIVGVEIDETAVAFAKQTYKERNLEYRRTDLNDPFSLGEQARFDLVIWVEAIEHFTPEQISDILPRIKDLLSPDGKLLITTPDLASSDGMNKYHLHEYSVDELKALIGYYFTIKSTTVKEKFIYMIARQK